MTGPKAAGAMTSTHVTQPAEACPRRDTVYATSDPAIFTPITIDPDLCIGCNLCVYVCQADLFLPGAVTGAAPLVVYGGECWYEGSCVDYCPVPGAIALNAPLLNRVRWNDAPPRG